MTDPTPTPGAASRLRKARESAGLSLTDLAVRVGLNENWWRDAEVDDNEVTGNLSLADISVFCGVVGISSHYLLFGPDVPLSTADLGFTELSEALNARIAREHLTVEAATELVGWELRDVLIDPSEFWNFTVDGLRDTCRFAGVSWPGILPLLDASAG
jgi:transcriptional regulator with XRE-family HTH domain